LIVFTDVRIGKFKGWRGAIAAGVLAFLGILSLSPVPSRACLFFQEFESSAKSSTRVSLAERVVYSLVQANDRASLQEKSAH
jgi:hypothetical protein